MADMSLIKQSANALVARLRSAEVTPHDLLDALEARISEVDGKVNALPTLCFDRARAHADELLKNTCNTMNATATAAPAATGSPSPLGGEAVESCCPTTTGERTTSQKDAAAVSRPIPCSPMHHGQIALSTSSCNPINQAAEKAINVANTTRQPRPRRPVDGRATKKVQAITPM